LPLEKAHGPFPEVRPSRFDSSRLSRLARAVRLALTLRTEIGTPRLHLDGRDLAAAARAFAAASAVGQEPGPRNAPLDVFRACAFRSGGLEHTAHRTVELLQRRVVEIGDGGARMDSRLKENLVGVNVA